MLEILSTDVGENLVKAALAWHTTQDDEAASTDLVSLATAIETKTIGANSERAITSALRAVELNGPETLRRHLAKFRDDGGFFGASLSAASQKLPTNGVKQTTFRYALIPHIGPTRIFTIPQGRERGVYVDRIVLIFPNWTRLEFNVRATPVNAHSQLNAENAEIFSPDGKSLGTVRIIQNPMMPTHLLFAQELPFLALTLTEEIRNLDVAQSPHLTLVRRDSIVRLGDAPIFESPPPLKNAAIQYLGMGLMRTARGRRDLQRHTIEFLFSDGAVMALKFYSSHHVGAAVDQVEANLFVPSATGDEQIRTTVKTTWGTQSLIGRVVMTAPDRELKIEILYPHKGGGGEIQIADVRCDKLQPAWRIANAPPYAIPLWFGKQAAVQEEEEILEAEPVVREEPQPKQPEPPPILVDEKVLANIGHHLKTGEIKKVSGQRDVGYEAQYANGHDHNWVADVQFGRGSNKDKVLRAYYKFPGEEGTLMTIEIDTSSRHLTRGDISGGTLLFFPAGSRYGDCAFFIPRGDLKTMLIEVTPFQDRVTAASSEKRNVRDWKSPEDESLQRYLAQEIVPLLPEWMESARSPAVPTAIKDATVPANINGKPSSRYVTFDSDPYLALVASFSRIQKYPIAPPSIRQNRKLYLYQGFNITRVQIWMKNDQAISGYYRLGKSLYPAVCLPDNAGGFYIYLMGKLFGVILYLQTKTMELREVTSILLNKKLSGDDSWQYLPEIRWEKLEGQMAQLDEQHQAVAIWQAHRKKINNILKSSATKSRKRKNFDEGIFDLAKWQGSSLTPLDIWMDHLPVSVHQHLGGDQDIAARISPSLRYLLQLDLMEEALILAEEGREDYLNLALSLMGVAISRALDSLLLYERSNLLQGRIELVRREKDFTGEDHLPQFLDRLRHYLYQALLDAISEDLPKALLDKIDEGEVLRRVQLPDDSVNAVSDRNHLDLTMAVLAYGLTGDEEAALNELVDGKKLKHTSTYWMELGRSSDPMIRKAAVQTAQMLRAKGFIRLFTIDTPEGTVLPSPKPSWRTTLWALLKALKLV